MSQKTNKKFAGLTAMFPGSYVFSVETTILDQNYEKKPEEVRIAKPVMHASIKTLLVNEAKAVKLPGNIDGLVINGGGKEGLTFAENEKLITEMFDLGMVNGGSSASSKKWTGDYKIAKDAVNAANEGEIIRLEAIIADAKEQIVALKAINQANEDAAQRFE